MRPFLLAAAVFLSACGDTSSQTTSKGEGHILSEQQKALQRAKDNASALEAAARDRVDAIDGKQ
jgi:hypothetical protein